MNDIIEDKYNDYVLVILKQPILGGYDALLGRIEWTTDFDFLMKKAFLVKNNEYEIRQTPVASITTKKYSILTTIEDAKTVREFTCLIKNEI